MMIQLWNRATVELSFRERICGGVPTDPKLIAGWVAANMPKYSAEEQAKIAERDASELPEATEEKASGMWTTFKASDEGVYIEGRQVKAMLKESANILRDLLLAAEASEGKVKAKPVAPASAEAKAKKPAEKKPAEKKDKSRYTALRSKVAERLFVEENRIYFLRDGGKIKVVDGSEERAIHVMTAQGPRDALKRTDFIAAPASIIFCVKWLRDGVVDADMIATLLEHASENGLGADRSQGNGRFTVVSITPVVAPADAAIAAHSAARAAHAATDAADAADTAAAVGAK